MGIVKSESGRLVLNEYLSMPTNLLAGRSFQKASLRVVGSASLGTDWTTLGEMCESQQESVRENTARDSARNQTSTNLPGTSPAQPRKSHCGLQWKFFCRHGGRSMARVAASQNNTKGDTTLHM